MRSPCNLKEEGGDLTSATTAAATKAVSMAGGKIVVALVGDAKIGVALAMENKTVAVTGLVLMAMCGSVSRQLLKPETTWCMHRRRKERSLRSKLLTATTLNGNPGRKGMMTELILGCLVLWIPLLQLPM